MLQWRQIFGFLAFVALLLFGFQNCGMQFEDDLSSTTDDMDASGLSFNPDGTFSFPMPGENGSNNGGGSSGGSGGSVDINLGSGGGSGGGLGGVGGGSGGPGSYDPYNDNHSKASLYPALPGSGGVMGNKLYYFNNNSVLNLGGHMNGSMLWQSYASAVSSWGAQQPGTDEREQLLVMSFKKLSQNAATTYFLDGTSICYQFSANVQMPNISTTYSWTERFGGRDGSENYYQINGYRTVVSGMTIVSKTEEEMTTLESAFCKAGNAYDRAAINAFFSVLQQYPILTPSGSSFSLRNTGRYYQNLNAALAPF